jgi:hypothetical protein
MPFKRSFVFPSVQIPELDSVVTTATDDCLPIRTDGDTINAPWPFKRFSVFPSVQIPELDSVTATDNSLPIRADGYSINRR